MNTVQTLLLETFKDHLHAKPDENFLREAENFIKDSKLDYLEFQFSFENINNAFLSRIHDNAVTFYNPYMPLDTYRTVHHTNLDGFFHHNSVYQLIHVIHGSISYMISSDEVVLQEGDILLMDTSCLYYDLAKPGDADIIYVCYSVPAFTEYSLENEGSRPTAQLLLSSVDHKQRYILYRKKHVGPAVRTEELVSALIKELKEMKYGYRNIIHNLSLRLLHHLNEHYDAELHAIGIDPLQAKKLIEIDQFIQSNIAVVNVSLLEEKFHFNRDYFNRLIKKHYGTTLTKYIQFRRLNEAKRLLLQTNYPVSQILNMVGYHNSQYFYKLFETDTGISPTEYRNQHKF